MAGRGKGALRIAIEDFLESFDLGTIFSGWIEKILDRLEDTNLKIYRGLVSHFNLGDKLPSYMQPDGLTVLVKSSQSGFFLSLFAILGVGAGGFFGAVAPFSRLSGYFVDQAYRTYRPSPDQVFQLARRGSLPDSNLLEYLKDVGVPDELISAYREATRPVLNSSELERLRRKNAVSEGTYQAELEKQGWTSERIDQIQSLFEQIPGAGDLISMAVREAFDPNVINKLGYLQNFPPEFADWMEKQGYDREWSERYWAAHWNLPSLTQGFEMLHRLRPEKTSNPFNTDDMLDLLRIGDIAPFYRDRLLEISYNPLTRVDVRRMFAMGVLTQEQVYQNYLDLGYTPENAQNLTDFTVRFERAEERGLTRSVVEASYKRGIITRAEAISQLGEIGYPDDIADFYLDIVDHDLEAQVTDLQMDAIKAKYITGELTDSTVTDQLGRLDMPAERSTAILELWRIQRDNRVSTPSRSELDDFYRRGFIDTDQYQEYLKIGGYSEDSIDLFTRRVDEIAAQDTAYELQQAQAEEERLRTSRLASNYQKDKASVNVSVAQARAAIADLKVNLHDLEEVGDIEDNKLTQDQLKAFIAQQNLLKAQLAFQYRSDRILEE